jgi:hypothetical protein
MTPWLNCGGGPRGSENHDLSLLLLIGGAELVERCRQLIDGSPNAVVRASRVLKVREPPHRALQPFVE